MAQVIACVAVLLGLGECLTRLLLTSPSRQTFDTELGHRYLPCTVFFDGSEGGARLPLNSVGLNDGEPGPKGARPRVAVVGDSMTMAYQVEREDNYVSWLNRLLPEMEFLNLGEADLGPVGYAALLRRHQAALAPDLVVFAFSQGDVEEVRRAPPRIERGPDGMITHLTPTVTAKQGLKVHLEPILQRSALATLLMRHFGARLLGLIGRTGGSADLAPQMIDAEVAEVITFVLRDAAARRPVAAVFIPVFKYGARRRSHMNSASARDAAVVTRAAERADVPFHLVEEDLVQQYQASGQPGHGFPNKRVGAGHLNPRGHAAVARGLADFLPGVFAQPSFLAEER